MRTCLAPLCATVSRLPSARSLSAFAARATICGPCSPVYGFSVTTASPAISALRSGKWSDTCPSVWPGVKSTRGDPGTASDPFEKRSTRAIGFGQKACVRRNDATIGAAFGFVAT